MEIVESVAAKKRTLFILHPPTVKKLKRFGFYERLESNPRIELRPRYDYFTFIGIVKRAEFLVTDGGSNQEEAFYMGKPCLLLRRATERREGLGKNVVLSKYDPGAISEFITFYEKHNCETMGSEISPSELILDHIMSYAEIKPRGRESEEA